MQEGPALNTKRKEHRFLKMLFTDEISMTGLFTFDSLNEILQKITGDKRDFGGVSIIAIGDLFQLPPVKMLYIYSMIHKRINDPWLKFKLHELTEIVRQSSDPEFAALLLRLREGKHTADDVVEIKKLEHTDTSSWPDQVTHLYMTNFLAGRYNEQCLSELSTEDEIVTVIAKDEGPKNTKIPIDLAISSTGNLKKSLRMCEGAKIMITKNLDVGDKLINGTLATIKKLDRVGNDMNWYPKGRVYIICDDESAGNKYKDSRLIQGLKDCVPINPFDGHFKYNGKEITRNQFPFIVAHGITTHKSQGSTLNYFVADLDRSCSTGSNRKVRVTEGMFYTMLSRGKNRKNIKIDNFDEDCIVVNKSAVVEMERLRSDNILDYSHPLKKSSN